MAVYIEKSPVTDIRLVETMLVALSAYGTLLGANHLKIMHPVNATVRDYDMTNISYIKNKQDEKLKGKPDEEKALAAARRAMEEMRHKRHIKEPDQLASGKSDENGNMIIEDLTPDEDIDIDEDNTKDSKNE